MILEQQENPQKESMEPMQETIGMEPAIPDNQDKATAMESEFINADSAEISPQQQMQIDAYSDNATLIVFSKESQPAILQSLQTGKNPIDSVARTANIIHKRLSDSLEGKGEEKMTEITMCLGAAHLVSELIVLADAAKLYKFSSQERLEAFRQTIMQYFESGLNDGTIDPVKLQQTIEPLMSKEQRDFGLQHAEKNGIMKTAPPSNGMWKKPPQEGQQPMQSGGILGGGANGI